MGASCSHLDWHCGCLEGEEIPEVEFYSLASLRQLRRFPRSPEDVHLRTTLADIDHEVSTYITVYFVYFAV